jgi:hypothetical protein
MRYDASIAGIGGQKWKESVDLIRAGLAGELDYPLMEPTSPET